jgi:O-antigen ligase
VNFLYFLLIAVAFAVIQCLIGGTRLLFSYPSYILLGSAAALTLVSFWRPVQRPSRIALLSTALLGGYVLLRAWYSPYPYLARPDLFMTAGCVIVYLITTVYLTGPRERLRIVLLILIIAAIQVGIGIYQFSQQSGLMLFGFLRPGHVARASGMFISPNHFAGYLEAAAMFAIALACWSRWGAAERLTAAITAVLCYVGVAISLSRGGYLSSAFSLVVMGILCIWVIARVRPGKATIPGAAVIITIVALFGAALVVGGLNKRISNRGKIVIAKDIRYANWAATMDQFRLSPVLGTGAGTHLIYGRLFRRPELQSDPVHAHGDYLEMLAEYGIVGATFSAFFLLAHIGNGIAGVRRITKERIGDQQAPPWSNTLALNLGALGVVAALMAHSVVDFNMHIPGNALFYAFAFGILANPGDRTTPVTAPGRLSPVILARFALVIAGIILVKEAAPRLKGEFFTEKARVALRDRNFKEAIRFAKEAILIEHENPDPWFYMGEAHRVRATTMPVVTLRKSFFEEAVSAYTRGLRLLPQDIHLLVRCGQALDGLERYDEAEAVYKKAIQWDPNLVDVHAFYGNHLLLKGDKEAAQEVFMKARKIFGGPGLNAGSQESQALMKFKESRGPIAKTTE